MIKIIFIPDSNLKVIVEATNEYKQIWKNEKNKIIKGFKKISGLEFKQKEIKVIVYEGMSRSGNLLKPMKLRASYNSDIKLGTLIHELGHRLLYGNGIFEGAGGLDDEQLLDLFLYDVWVDLYGKNFAQRNVDTESARKGYYDYESAWKWVLAMTKDERKRKLEEIVSISS